MPLPSFTKSLRRNNSGVAMTEFALSMPLLFSVGLWGLETANQAVVQMEISQLAMHVADNASRIGDTSLLEDRKIYEADIIDTFVGSNVQGGARIDLFEHGRVIVSSLEVVPDTDDQQYIHWQRCKGKKVHPSSYGYQGDGLGTGIPGMGPTGQEVYALKGEAVIFVEVSYDYQSLISDLFTNVETLSATAAFNVRDQRDLTQIYQRDADNPDEVASCDKHDGLATVAT